MKTQIKGKELNDGTITYIPEWYVFNDPFWEHVMYVIGLLLLCPKLRNSWRGGFDCYQGDTMKLWSEGEYLSKGDVILVKPNKGTEYLHLAEARNMIKLYKQQIEKERIRKESLNVERKQRYKRLTDLEKQKEIKRTWLMDNEN